MVQLRLEPRKTSTGSAHCLDELFRATSAAVFDNRELGDRLFAIKRWRSYRDSSPCMDPDVNVLGHALETVRLTDALGARSIESGELTADELSELKIAAIVHDFGKLAARGGISKTQDCHTEAERAWFRNNIHSLLPALDEAQTETIRIIYNSTVCGVDRLAKYFQMVETVGSFDFALRAAALKPREIRWEELGQRMLDCYKGGDTPIYWARLMEGMQFEACADYINSKRCGFQDLISRHGSLSALDHWRWERLIETSQTFEKYSVGRLRTALRKSWSAETSSDPINWSELNPSWGQCAVTALVLNDFLGGELVSSEAALPGGKNILHYSNLIHLPLPVRLDLTACQFPRDTVIPKAEADCKEYDSTRQYVLSFPATQHRYEFLRRRVDGTLKASESSRPKRN